MPFPSVSLLDSFIRAAENPLKNGGKWAALGGTGENNNAGHITGEQWVPNNAFTAAKEDGAYWTPQQYSGVNAVALEVHTAPSSERYLGLWCCLTNPTLTAKNGYRLRLVNEIAGLKAKYILERVTESVATVIAEVTKQTYAVGDRIGISVEEGKVRAWHKSGAGEWTEVASVADATYHEGYVGISGDGNLVGARNFEAGGGEGHLHELTATQASKASLAHSITRTLTAKAQKSKASLAHSLARALATSQGQAAVLRSGPERHLTATQAQAASVEHINGKVFKIGQGQVATLTKSDTRFKGITVGFKWQIALSYFGSVAVWAHMDPATHNGYRLRAQWLEGLGGVEPREEELYAILLEKVVAGVGEILEGILIAFNPEQNNDFPHWVSLKLRLSTTGELTCELNGEDAFSVTDLTFREGRVGMESTESMQVRQFEINGVIVDYLERDEAPLDKHWVKLPWVPTIGVDIAGFGWQYPVPPYEGVPLEVMARGGAYWTASLTEPEEGERPNAFKVPLVGVVTRTMTIVGQIAEAEPWVT